MWVVPRWRSSTVRRAVEELFTIGRAANNTTAEAFKVGDKVALRLTDGTRTSSFSGADGNPLTGTCAVFRLHPAAVLRLQTLMKDRYVTGGNPLIFPVPWCMVVRDAQGFTTAQWYEPDELIAGVGGKISFHDGRGLIVDPLYVAALFADLQTGLTGLTGKTSQGDLGDRGRRREESIAKLQSASTLYRSLRRPARERVSTGASRRDAGDRGRQQQPNRHGPAKRTRDAECGRRHRGVRR